MPQPYNQDMNDPALLAQMAGQQQTTGGAQPTGMFQATNPITYTGSGGDSLDNLAMTAGIGGLLGGVPLNNLAAGTLGYAAGNLGIDQARQLPSQLGEAAASIANQVGQAAQFKPYTVTTSAGGTQFDPSGMSQTLDQQSQATVDSLRQQAAQQSGMLGNVTPEQLMSQMNALRQPEQERAQQQLDNRLAAQGRLGVSTAAYGGTPEQLAMQKAIQEQQSADALSSIQGARQLQGMDIANLTGMLGAAGIPQEQLTAAMSPAMTSIQLAQRPSELQAQALSNLGQQAMSGIPSAVNAEALLRQAQMESIMGGLGVTGGKDNYATQNPLGNLLGKGFDWLTNYAGGLFSGGVDPESASQPITFADIARLTGGAAGEQTTNYDTPTGIPITGTAGRTGGGI